MAFPTIRPGWDDIFTETMSKFGINPIDDAVSVLFKLELIHGLI